MKTTGITSWTFIFRALGFMSFAFISCTGDAQSIVGRWREVSNKHYFNAEGAKKYGMPSVERQMPTGAIFEYEFKADHTYIVHDGPGNSDQTKGEWSVSGDQLTMKAAVQVREGKGSQIYTFSIIGDKMIMTMIVQPPYNTWIFKQDEITVRI